MSILSEESLEFSRKHISKYYDSDFFPRAMEFDALWHNWDEVKQELTSRNVPKLQVMPPRTLAAKKPKGSYRVVHQLEPLDALIYTALAFQVAPAVEMGRPPIEEFVACSYRINLDDGNFFASGSGYPEFNNNTEELAATYEHVLSTDITDFYNQIYLHRLNNAIEFVNSDLKQLGDDIEWFISTLNNKSSQGIPVGPAASIVLAEAVLIDIDQFIQSRGMAHTRYVDDIRIFSHSARALERVLEELTVYLYEQHRLTLAAEKTEVVESSKFVEDQLHSRYAIERLEIFKTLEFFNPYTDEMEEVELGPDLEKTFLQERLLEVFEKVIASRYLDLGLGRNLIRKAKRNQMPDLVAPILSNFRFFAPIVSDVILYLVEVMNEDTENDLVNAFIEICNSDAVDNILVRFWVEWYLSSSPNLLHNSELLRFIYEGSNVQNQARAAVATRNLAWVREKKNHIYNLGNWDRRGVLFASQVLPSDERKHWLKMTIGTTPFITDKWVAKWILETT